MKKLFLFVLFLAACTDSPKVEPEKPKTPVEVEEQEESNEVLWASNVDSYFNMSELTKNRESYSKTKTCTSGNSFKRVISDAVDSHITPYKNQIHKLSSFYSVPSDIELHIETSLISHKLCENFSSSNVGDILKNVPNNSVISLMNEFSKKSNSLRENKEEFKNFWKKTFSCLAYTESLSTADTTASYNVAKKFNYNKPKGVKFYSDPYQNEVSRYNIGLFQFTPLASGNINPCILNWNSLYPECKISTKSDQKTLVELLGSSSQGFNAFCGVNKIVGTFAIQQNSSKKSAIFKSEENKEKGQRCVTPFIWAGWGYNHFGPFQNSTGRNLEKLLKCVLSK